MSTNQQTQAALEAFLARQAEANASIEPAEQALKALESKDSKPKE